MPLRKSPTLTPALLAAIRRNVSKSTGPRTPEGKARMRFNAFKHGLRARLFREALMARGADVDSYDEELRWYELMLGPLSPRDQQILENGVRKEWWRAEQLKEFFLPTNKVRMFMKTKGERKKASRISPRGTTQQRALRSIWRRIRRDEKRREASKWAIPAEAGRTTLRP
jgi:hypothetical protein